VIGAVILYECLDVLHLAVTRPLEVAFEQEYSKLSEEEKKNMDKVLDEEKPLFIPLPLTAQQNERTYYRGSDPEWQGFVKISKDKALQAKIRRKLMCSFRPCGH
jgi:hypothetical protein